MRLFHTNTLIVSLIALSFTTLGARATEGTAGVATKQVSNQPLSDGEITSSPKISKAEVKRLERVKEKQGHANESMSGRAWGVTTTTLSY